MVTSVKMTTAVIIEALRAKQAECVALNAADIATYKKDIAALSGKAQKLAAAYGRSGTKAARAKMGATLYTLSQAEKSLER